MSRDTLEMIGGKIAKQHHLGNSRYPIRLDVIFSDGNEIAYVDAIEARKEACLYRELNKALRDEVEQLRREVRHEG
jgi:hypothetical protein